MPSYQKLVRDNIPEIIRENGEEPITRQLDEGEYKQALTDKLKEEAEEVGETTNRESVRKELADVLEVVDTLANAYNIDKEDIASFQKDKREERGGFKQRIYLEDVDTA